MQHAHTVKELVQISRDGLDFYTEASGKVENPRLQTIFTQMADHKRQIIDSLSSKLQMNDEHVPTSGTMAGKFRQGYADLRAAMSAKDDKIYVAQLEETEDRLLHHFEDAIEKADDPTVKSILQTHMPQVRACHDQMRELKHQMNA